MSSCRGREQHQRAYNNTKETYPSLPHSPFLFSGCYQKNRETYCLDEKEQTWVRVEEESLQGQTTPKKLTLHGTIPVLLSKGPVVLAANRSIIQGIILPAGGGARTRRMHKTKGVFLQRRRACHHTIAYLSSSWGYSSSIIIIPYSSTTRKQLCNNHRRVRVLRMKWKQKGFGSDKHSWEKGYGFVCVLALAAVCELCVWERGKNCMHWAKLQRQHTLFKFWSPRPFVKQVPRLYATRQHDTVSKLNKIVAFLPLLYVGHRHGTKQHPLGRACQHPILSR